MMNSEINTAIEYLSKGKVILCPTDTIWGLSCDATNENAIDKIYKIKARDKSKSLIVLVSSIEMLKSYIESFPINIENIINSYNKPVTVVYPEAKNLAENVFAQDKSIAIRIVKNGFIKELIETYNKPIVSTSANFSNEKTAFKYSEIDSNLKKLADYIVEEKYGKSSSKSSTIIKLLTDSYQVIRD